MAWSQGFSCRFFDINSITQNYQIHTCHLSHPTTKGARVQLNDIRYITVHRSDSKGYEFDTNIYRFY